jgi:hypothetical protein
MSSCPIDRGPLLFYGVSQRKTGEFAEDPETGKQKPVVEAFHWSTCSTCASFVQADANGTIVAVYPEKSPPEKSLFIRGKDD